ncbi:hypothetical protein [Pseudonocardia adelaidensis]|uniref:Uncharacterized protein n=1 Tax=Pseudonocardia adelaidensis TaxID=648754 RepID=A0ABP9NPU9_9PSEU
MAGDEELERTVRKLAIEHAETRWLALRLDDDVKEIRQDLRTMRAEQNERFDVIDGRLNSIDGGLQAHDGRFDSTDAVLRSLHQMVGQVLERLPEEPQS